MAENNEAPALSASEGASEGQSLPHDLPQSTEPTKKPRRTKSASSARSHVTPLYRSIVQEARRMLLASGVAMEPVGELAGLADRHVNKFLNPDSPSGRQASWATLQSLLDTIAPDGFDVRLTRRRGPLLDAVRARFELRFDKAFSDARTRRELLAEWGGTGGRRKRELPEADRREIGRKLAAARTAKLAPAERTKLASQASAARWAKHRKSKIESGNGATT